MFILFLLPFAVGFISFIIVSLIKKNGQKKFTADKDHCLPICEDSEKVYSFDKAENKFKRGFSWLWPLWPQLQIDPTSSNVNKDSEKDLVKDSEKVYSFDKAENKFKHVATLGGDRGFSWVQLKDAGLCPQLHITASTQNHVSITSDEWNDIKEKMKHREFVGSTSKENFFMPEVGLNEFRILPILNSSNIHILRRQHYVNCKVAQCGKHFDTSIKNRWSGECPLCDAFENGDNKSKYFKPTEKFYYNVLHNGEVKMFSAGSAVHQQIVQGIVGSLAEVNPLGDITDPVNGRNIKMTTNMVTTSSGLSYPNHKISFCPPSSMGTKKFVEESMKSSYDLNFVAKSWSKTSDELLSFKAQVCFT